MIKMIGLLSGRGLCAEQNSRSAAAKQQAKHFSNFINKIPAPTAENQGGCVNLDIRLSRKIEYVL